MSDVLVIDSGVGGLTALYNLQQTLPYNNYVYVGDTAYCPYGTKNIAEISTRLFDICRYFDGKYDICVLACNTASLCKDWLQSYLHRNVVDIITPTCNKIVSLGYKRIALLATNLTVNSGTYQRTLSDYGITVICYPCSNFVPLVENNVSIKRCYNVVCNTLQTLPQCNVDGVILGCTHFPLLSSSISKVIGSIPVISSSEQLSEAVKLLSVNQSNTTTTLYATSSNNKITQTAKRLGIKYDGYFVFTT